MESYGQPKGIPYRKSHQLGRGAPVTSIRIKIPLPEASNTINHRGQTTVTRFRTGTNPLDSASADSMNPALTVRFVEGAINVC